MDQAAAEGVASAHAVHDMYQIFRRETRLSVLVEHARPLVVRSGDAAAQSDRHILAAKALRELLCHTDIALTADLAGIDIGSFRMDAEYVRRIFV